MNFLTEHKIEQYAELTAKITEVAKASKQAADSLKEVEKRLTDMTLLIKNINTYQKTKPVYAAYRKAKDKEKYRTAHESDIILYEAAAKAIKAAGITKLPSLAALQAEYAALQGAERSPVCRLWEAEKAGQGIRRYQEEYRQYFESGTSA